MKKEIAALKAELAAWHWTCDYSVGDLRTGVTCTAHRRSLKSFIWFRLTYQTTTQWPSSWESNIRSSQWSHAAQHQCPHLWWQHPQLGPLLGQFRLTFHVKEQLLDTDKLDYLQHTLKDGTAKYIHDWGIDPISRQLWTRKSSVFRNAMIAHAWYIRCMSMPLRSVWAILYHIVRAQVRSEHYIWMAEA